jgi:hypothetical protein
MQIEKKSSKFNTGEYGGQSDRVQNSAKSCWAVLVAWAGTKYTKDIFSSRVRPMDPGDHMLSQKLLVDAGVDPFLGRNRQLSA